MPPKTDLAIEGSQAAQTNEIISNDVSNKSEG